MLSYYENELIRELRRDDGVRCFRCNTLLPATLALRGEGLCTACAEGETIQFTPYRGPTGPAVPSRRAAWTARFARLDESLFGYPRVLGEMRIARRSRRLARRLRPRQPAPKPPQV
jgi:hypothetical protein